MRLRYPGTCRVCGVGLAAGADAIYERTSKTFRCISHDVIAPVPPAPSRSLTQRPYVVRQHLEGDVPVHGVLCFIEADWPLLGGTSTTRGVQSLWPKKLYPRLQAEGPLTEQLISEIHRQLAHALRPA